LTVWERKRHNGQGLTPILQEEDGGKMDQARPPAPRCWVLLWHGMGLVALLLVLGLTWARADKVRAQLVTAERTRQLVKSDDDLYRLPRYVGTEWPIVAHLRSHYPPGTAVSAPWHRRSTLRIMLGFRIALLPEYPMRADASLLLIRRGRVQEHHRIIASGFDFVLVERQTRAR
jgi:hypothetical protein